MTAALGMMFINYFISPECNYFTIHTSLYSTEKDRDEQEEEQEREREIREKE